MVRVVQSRRIVEAIIDNHARNPLLGAEVDLPPGIRLAVGVKGIPAVLYSVDRAGGVALGGRDCRIAKPRLPPIVCLLDPIGFHLVAIGVGAAGRLANEEGHQEEQASHGGD